MPLGPQIVTYGNVQSTFVLTVQLTFVATATVSTVEQNLTIPGLQVGDQISDLTYIGGVFPNTLLALVNARVSANNTMTVALQNTTAGSLTYPAGSYYLEVNRPLSGLTMTSIQ
jgi:hypothetical protein